MKLEKLNPVISQKLAEENNKLLQAELEYDEKRDKELLSSHAELVKSIRDLNKNIKDIKTGKGDESLIQKWFTEKLSPITQLTSLSGILRTGGNLSKPGSLTNAIFNTLADRRDEKLTKKAGERAFISTVVEGTAAGRSIKQGKGEAAAIEFAREKLIEKQKLEKEIRELTEQQKLLSSTEIVGSGLSQEDAAKLEAAKEKLKTVLDFRTEKQRQETPIAKPAIQPDTVEPESTISKPDRVEQNFTSQQIEQFREELTQGIKEGFERDKENLSPAEKVALEKDPEYFEAALEGALEEVKKLSKEQLLELKRIAEALEDSKEEEFEKSRKPAPQLTEELKPETKKEGKGLLGNILDFGANIVKRAGWLGRMVQVIGAVTAAVRGAVKGIAGTLGSAGMRAGGLAVRGVAALGRGALAAGGLAARGAMTLGSAALPVAAAAARGIGSVITKTVSGVGALTPKLIQTGSNTVDSVKDFASTATNTLKDRFTTIKTGADTVLDRTREGGTKILESVKTGADTVLDRTRESGNKVLDRTKEFSTTATNTIKDRFTTVKEIGSKVANVGGNVFKGLMSFGGIAARLASKAVLPVTAALAAYDGIQGAANANEMLGIDGRDATLGEKAIAGVGGIASGLTGGLISADAIAKPLNNFFSSLTESRDKTIQRSESDREKLSAAVDRINESITEYETGAIAKVTPMASNTQANTVINNNQNVTNVVRTPVRSPEPSYNRALDRSFVY